MLSPYSMTQEALDALQPNSNASLKNLCGMLNINI